MGEKLYIISSPVEVGQVVYRKYDKNFEDPLIVIGFIVNYVNERGDAIGYDILLSNLNGDVVPCKPFEICLNISEEKKENNNDDEL